MKLILPTIIMTSLLLTQNTFACQKEAQVIGQVSSTAKVINHGVTLGCYFQAQFTEYSQSAVCPLTQDEIKSELIEDPSCSLKMGDFVSGVLVKKPDSSLYLEM